jgi:putative addiction module component (TIGR02574 family)
MGLILNLDESAEDDPTEVELAWEAEIQRRLDAYRRGELRPIPSERVFAKARALEVSHVPSLPPAEDKLLHDVAGYEVLAEPALYLSCSHCGL